MSKWQDLLDDSAPASLESKVLAAAQGALRENRRVKRRELLLWFGGSVFASFAGIFMWNSRREPSAERPDFAMLEFFEDANEILSDEDIDLISELELLEELDKIENWSES